MLVIGIGSIKPGTNSSGADGNETKDVDWTKYFIAAGWLRFSRVGWIV